MTNDGWVWWNPAGPIRKPKKYLHEVGTETFRKVIFACENCDGEMWHYVCHDDVCYCPKCAFKKGLIDDQKYIQMEYYWAYFNKARAVVVDDEIYVAFDNDKFPWEMSDRDYRKSKKYKQWRTKVFKRDGYKCQVCGQVGGTLNAHHIKTFKDYPKLRFDVNNGITLCEKCHREAHRIMRKEKRNKDEDR